MAKREQSPRRRLRLDRRDGEDLILESAARAEAEDEALSTAMRDLRRVDWAARGAPALRGICRPCAAVAGLWYLPFLARLVSTGEPRPNSREG